MSTDRELLELAAKAIGLEIKPAEVKNVTAQGDDRFIGYLTEPEQWPRGWFDPLTNDGDALRLALALNIEYEFQSSCIVVAEVSRIGGSIFDKKHSATVDYVPEEMFASSYGPDISHANYLVSTGMIRGKASAVRLAIVCAAAEVGRAMP